jgi:hypothetical protein
VSLPLFFGIRLYPLDLQLEGFDCLLGLLPPQLGDPAFFAVEGRGRVDGGEILFQLDELRLQFGSPRGQAGHALQLEIGRVQLVGEGVDLGLGLLDGAVERLELVEQLAILSDGVSVSVLQSGVGTLEGLDLVHHATAFLLGLGYEGLMAHE